MMADNAKSKEIRLTAGDILRSIRETRNIPIRAVSKAIKVSELAIQKIERNQSGGSIDTFIKLCAFYEIRIEDLIFWTTEESSTDVEKAKDILYKMLISAVAKRAEGKLRELQEKSVQTDNTETPECVDADDADGK